MALDHIRCKMGFTKPPQLRRVGIMLAGKTGSGKSETANTIVGRKQFKSKTSASLVTRTSQKYESVRFGQRLQVIDAPGFADTTLSTRELTRELAKAVALSGEGVHAILVLTEVGRFTEDDIEQLLEGFGKDLMSFAIVIITKIDYLKREKKELDEYLKTAPTPLTEFLSKINHRFLGVDNLSGAAEKDDFVKKLLTMVQTLVRENGGICYTNDMHQKAIEETEQNVKLVEEKT